MYNEEIRQNAKQKVEAKISFGIHFAIYLAVMTLLTIINLKSSPDYWWFMWPLLGWGIGIVIHGVSVYFSSGGSSIKDRMIEEEMNKYS